MSFWWKFLSLAVLDVVKRKTSSTAYDENFIKISISLVCAFKSCNNTITFPKNTTVHPITSQWEWDIRCFWVQDSGPIFYLWLSKVLANERRCYKCNIFSHWLRPCSAIYREQALNLYVVLCQKQVSRAGTSNYIPQKLWDVITCPCAW